MKFMNFIFLILLFFISRAVQQKQPAIIKDKKCSYSDIEFFKLIKSVPPGGYVVEPKEERNWLPQCQGNKTVCRIQLFRKYLPDATSFSASTLIAKQSKCDDYFSQLVGHWLTSSFQYANHTSVPYFYWSSKTSIGRYIRTASILQYRIFQGRATDVLMNVYYPGASGWPWTETVDECSGLDSNWNCAFLPFFKQEEHPSQQFQGNVLIDEKKISKEKVFDVRTTAKNHIVQVLLFGKLLSVIARPSSVIRNYLIANLVNLNSHIWDPLRTDLSHGSKFASYDEFYAYATEWNAQNSSQLQLSVSMQVRQGDSCDYVLTEHADNITRLWERVRSKRPCFSVDSYMRKLYRLAARYNIKRIFLATDSQEMIDRVYKEPRFNWIFLNISRVHFNKAHGWIEKRNDIDNRVTLLSGAADMHLMQFSDMMVASMSSTFAKVGYYMMVGYHMRVLPFVSLDYPLSCETIDACDENGLGALNVTVEDMLVNPVRSWTWTNHILFNWYCKLGQRWPPKWWEDKGECCVEGGYKNHTPTHFERQPDLKIRNCSILSV